MAMDSALQRVLLLFRARWSPSGSTIPLKIVASATTHTSYPASPPRSLSPQAEDKRT
ncbi:hypothetical protein Syun_004661 [Stephania yunnanensis]|uniref:Uncharacterized protein n=1 Tax=Stephania yunnanensis TaxID=152371 RepID=A0AAP0L6T0_9MAGN